MNLMVAASQAFQLEILLEFVMTVNSPTSSKSRRCFTRDNCKLLAKTKLINDYILKLMED